MAIGGTTVCELQHRMESPEFTDWIAYYRIEPFCNENLHAARSLAMLYNINREKGAKALDAEDFMLKFEVQEKVGDRVVTMFKQMSAVDDNG